jgi:hypothetical protein
MIAYLQKNKERILKHFEEKIQNPAIAGRSYEALLNIEVVTCLNKYVSVESTKCCAPTPWIRPIGFQANFP